MYVLLEGDLNNEEREWFVFPAKLSVWARKFLELTLSHQEGVGNFGYLKMSRHGSSHAKRILQMALRMSKKEPWKPKSFQKFAWMNQSVVIKVKVFSSTFLAENFSDHHVIGKAYRRELVENVRTEVRGCLPELRKKCFECHLSWPCWNLARCLSQVSRSLPWHPWQKEPSSESLGEKSGPGEPRV